MSARNLGIRPLAFCSKPLGARYKSSNPSRFFLPRLEKLESRLLLAGVPEMLGDINPGSGNSIQTGFDSTYFKVVESGGHTFFTASTTGSNTTNLYVFDNAAGSATLLAQNTSQLLRTADGMVYTIGTYTAQVSGLLRIDPTSLSVSKIPIPTNQLSEFAVLGNDLYGFGSVRHPVTDQDLGKEFARLNQLTGQWQYITEIRAGTSLPIADIVATSDSRVLFFADDGVTGRELWVSDGTAAGTRLTGDLVPAGKFHYPLAPFAAGDTFYWVMNANPGLTQLWRFSPTDAAPVMLAEHREVDTNTFAAYGNDLIYTTFDYDVYHRVWRTSPNSPSPTLLVGGLYDFVSKPTGVHNGELYFVASDPSVGPYQHHLWKSDGTAEGTAPFFTFVNANGNNSGPFGSAGGYMYFNGHNDDYAFGSPDPRYGSELWRTDGTAEGTELVADIFVGVNGSGPWRLVNAGENLFFIANNGVHGYEPWVLRAAKDLRAGELKVIDPDNAPSDAIDWGTELTVEFLVGYFAPNGQVSGETTAHLALSTTPGIGVGQPIVATVTVPSVEAGTSERVQVTFTLPSSPPAGFEEARKLYAGLLIDANNVLDEANESNNWNQGLGIDVVALREPPQVVHVLTHGFNPNPLGGWESFRSAWQTTFPEAVRDLALQTPYAGKTVEYVAQWDSSRGWIEAFAGAVVLGLMNLPHPIARAIPPIYKQIVRTEIQLALLYAGQLAEMAADKIVSDLLAGGFLTQPEDNQLIHLIGHSRGAAVNARVTQLLANKGYQVAQYTSLDGFSNDWPFGASVLADVELQTAALGAARRVNFMVEDGLGSAAFDYFLDNLLSEHLTAALGRDVDLDLPEWAEPLLGGWRAPARDGFENVLIVADGAFQNSHHTNVSSLYFASGSNPAGSDYLRMSPLFATGSPFAALDATMEGEGTPPLHSTAGNFIDGSFQWLAGLTEQIAQLGAVESEEPLFELMAELLARPEYLLSTLWQASGDVLLSLDGGNARIELRQTGDTHIGQPTLLDVSAERLTFSLEVVATGSGDALEVWFNEFLVADINLETATDVQQSIDISGFAGQRGEFRFRLTGPISDAAIVRLDDLRIDSPGSLDSLRATTFGGEMGQPMQVRLTAIESDQSGIEAVSFYQESNGLPGLQPGSDFYLGFDLPENGWSITVSAGGIAYGVQRFYAVASDGSEAGPVIATELTLSPKGLPYHWSGSPEDVDRDGFIVPLDALIIINRLNLAGPGLLDYPTTIPRHFFDTSGDDYVTAVDALKVINYLNANPPTIAGEAEGKAKDDQVEAVIDAAAAHDLTLVALYGFDEERRLNWEEFWPTPVRKPRAR